MGNILCKPWEYTSEQVAYILLLLTAINKLKIHLLYVLCYMYYNHYNILRHISTFIVHLDP